ncbi:MAG TPA: pyridoxamine 5'-phosphate oxidase family protein [Caulobacteraceae bacterium]|jgi:general stress protein 26|nr:pyridoxamine 5'-phosphate oxidase family protein [Caulobacteraceae bacterium]
MTTDLRDKAAVEHKLWAEIEDTRVGMLATVERIQHHFQPMTAFGEPESGRIWFYTRSDSDIAVAAEGGAEAMFVFVSRDRELQASIRGELRTTLDQLHRDKFWNSTVAAWFSRGKDDPDLTMLCLDCQDTMVWISDVGGVKFAWEIARANLTGTEPRVGGKTTLDLG